MFAKTKLIPDHFVNEVKRLGKLEKYLTQIQNIKQKNQVVLLYCIA